MHPRRPDAARNLRATLAGIALLGVLAVLPACATAPPGAGPAAAEPRSSPPDPSLADFADGDRSAVEAMLRDVPGRFRSPYNLLPGARSVTTLVTCRVESVQDRVVGLRCMSGVPALDLAIDEPTTFHVAVDWAQAEFGVVAPTVAVGEVRTCVVHGSGFGGGLWKRFMVFPGPARGT